MKRVVGLFFLLFSIVSFGQGNQQWGSYFSYNDVQDITESTNRVYAASESAMFTLNVGTNELKTITSVEGLKAETITAIHHSPEYNKTLVGNANGLLMVVNNDFSVLNKIDIIQETTVAAAKKRINHIYEHEGKAYLSCDFGIAVFDLATLEFGDTYYLGPSGAEIPVKQATVFNGYLYTATLGYGIRRGLLSNPNLNDFSQWQEEYPGNWTGIVSYAGTLFTTDIGSGLYKVVNGTPELFVFLPATAADIREANGYMIVTCANRIYVYNDSLIQIFQLNLIPGEEVTFTCATVVGGEIFIGTREKGVFSMPMNNISAVTNITPDGPQNSNVFRMKKSQNFLWVVFGAYSAIYDPYPLRYYGISKFSAEGWSHISNEDLFSAASISDIEVNPVNENQAYAASFHDGLIKIENDIPVAIYDEDPVIQNGPETMNTNGFGPSVRINSLAFDKTGNLWMTNARVNNAIKVLKANGTWSSYSVQDIVGSALGNDYGKMAIDRNGTKWIPSSYNGIIAFNENLNDKFLAIVGEEGNLPSDNSTCVAIDNNNRLWIGTNRGLRVLSSVERFMSEDELTTNAIIIMEDGLAQELMYEQPVTDILVDGSNNKWIGTGGAGAFLVSPDGQRTLFHFTKENSPLPSNNINDIEIDNRTGEVFFATDRGMVSYKGTSTEAAGNLNNVYVFPNPVRPNFDGDVNISGLMDSVNVKITDIEGNLVYETTSEGGTVLWDTRAFGKYKVASGVYMIFISSEDGTETKVKKVMIIRG